MNKVLDHLNYANVVATLALFAALGGTSYAVTTLPRNSVGSTQLRPNSVRGSEIRKQAVSSSDIDDRAVKLRDISKSTRDALKGQVGPPGPPGPPGPTVSAIVNSVGASVKGGVGTSNQGTGARVVEFTRSIANCVPAASLTALAGDPKQPPPGATIRVDPVSDRRVVVRTWDNNNAAAFYPFNLIVAC